MRRVDGEYVMCVTNTLPSPHRPISRYFQQVLRRTGQAEVSQHCIGGAIADTIEGPYHTVSDFYECNRTANGVIGPAWFKDTDGKQYVAYKTEIPAKFLEIREVANAGAKEGVQWTSNAVQLFQVDGQGFSDGDNMEAPYLFKRGGVYFLTYSTHFTMDGSYDVCMYATARNVRGPYTRAKEPLLKSGMQYGCKLIGPVGASFQRLVDASKQKTRVIFHGLNEETSFVGEILLPAFLSRLLPPLRFGGGIPFSAHIRTPTIVTVSTTCESDRPQSD
ncbi:glycoside hydrolase family 43 protein [Karstenula rhodostoma CBS 690.94]|uniref:Glycoside hydrolase family 43 protein n=1 Tax=Karstenula rhodostoma CBS 690.94 TaxID=1392251 RepID=A0A9P4PIS4_9PLEO|nr:glycoside hydrolase family 43 protein [Karstenula rhodostoma CBS 690.94]